MKRSSHRKDSASIPRRRPEQLLPANPTAEAASLAARRRRFLALLMFLSLVLLAWGTTESIRAWRLERVRAATIPELQQMVDQDPNNAVLLSLLGARLALAERFPAASGMLYHAVARGDTQPIVWLTMAGSAAAGGNIRLAMGMLEAGSRQGVPGLADAMDRVRALGKAAKPADAATAILPGGAISLADARLPHTALSGIVDWWARGHKESSGYGTREGWAQAMPEDAETQRLWGEMLTADGQYHNAEGVLAHAISLEPNSAEAHLAAGDLMFRMRRLDDAGDEYLMALKLHPDSEPALLGAGRVAIARQLIPTAIAFMDRATTAAPESADAWIGLGQAYLGQLLTSPKAVEAFAKAHRLAPHRTDFYDDYGQSLQLSYRLDDAEAIAAKRVKEAPGDAGAHLLLARLYLANRPSQERARMAEKEYREVLVLAPHYPRAEVELARLLLDEGHNTEALDLAQDAKNREPFDSFCATTLVRALQQNGRTDEARKAGAEAAAIARYHSQFDMLQDQIRNTPTDPTLHSQLAALYASTGQTAKAQAENDLALRLKQHPASASSPTAILAVPGLAGEPAGP